MEITDSKKTIEEKGMTRLLIKGKKNLEPNYPYAELSVFDDVCSSLFLDTLFLGFKTHKFMNTSSALERPGQEEGQGKEIESNDQKAQQDDQKAQPEAHKNDQVAQEVQMIDQEENTLKDNTQESFDTKLTSQSDALALILTYFIRNYILPRKEVDDSATQLIEFFKDPDRLNSLKSGNSEKENELFQKAISQLKEEYSHIFSRNLSQREDMLLKEYLMIYLPNSGFEVNRTFRYSSSEKAEAKLVATQVWNPGDQIRACTGVIAELNREDELALKNRDFSVMYSTKKKCMCLFLGPARFVNHDCKANTKFININHNTVSFKVVKPIQIGEEITTFYSGNYFGENNQECLCMTCESFGRNGFAQKKILTKDEAGDDHRAESPMAIAESVKLGTVKARAATARAANFNYFKIPNFPLPKREKEKKSAR